MSARAAAAGLLAAAALGAAAPPAPAAPVVGIVSPEGDEMLRHDETLRLDLTAGPQPAALACSVDGEAFAPCATGTAVGPFGPGLHVVRVIAMDAAGGLSDPDAEAARRFVLAMPAPPAPHGPHAASAAPAAAPAAAPMRLSPAIVQRPRPRRRGPRLRLSFAVPRDAATARIALHRTGSGGPRELLARRVAVVPGRTARVSVRIGRAEARRLRTGLFLATVALAAEPGALGTLQAHWMRVLPR